MFLKGVLKFEEGFSNGGLSFGTGKRGAICCADRMKQTGPAERMVIIMEKIGFTSVTFRKKSIDEVLEIAKLSGAGCIEWGGDIHMPPGRPELAEVLRQKTEAAGIETVSYGTYYRVSENNPQKFSTICSIAEILGAKIVRVWLGTKSSAATSEDEFASMAEEVKTLADIAAAHDLTVAFEFHHSTLNDNAGTAVRFIERCHKQNVKTYWQPFTAAEDIDNLKEVLPYLAAVHVFNWDKEGRRYLLREGTERWQSFFRIIRDAGVTPNYILEFTKDDSDENFIEDIKCLKTMLR